MPVVKLVDATAVVNDDILLSAKLVNYEDIDMQQNVVLLSESSRPKSSLFISDVVRTDPAARDDSSHRRLAVIRSCRRNSFWQPCV